MSGLAQAVWSTFSGLRRETAIEPRPENVTIKVHPEDYADLVINYVAAGGVLDPVARKFMGYDIEADPVVSPGTVVVALHHEITAAFQR